MTAAEAIRQQCEELDSISDFRDSYDAETDLPAEWDRNYESKSVAKQLYDGRWVGYTYWYGGGKHGSPEVIEWIDDAYYLDAEEVVTTVLKFKKKEMP